MCVPNTSTQRVIDNPAAPRGQRVLATFLQGATSTFQNLRTISGSSSPVATFGVSTKK